MPEVPWELLATRLGRYLQLSYVSAVVAGAFVLFAVWVDAIGGPPEQRRSEISKRLTQVTAHRSILFVVILVLVMIFVSYLVGGGIRNLTWWAANKVRVAWQAAMVLTGVGLIMYKARMRFFQMADVQTTHMEHAERTDQVYRGRSAWIEDKRFNISTPIGVLAYLWSMLSLTRPKPDQVWANIVRTYGESRVAKVLKPHPVQVSGENAWRMESVSEYCNFWLLRYAKDLAITPSATRALIASSAFVPVFFIPSVFENVLGTDASLTQWANRLEFWIAIVLLYLILSGQRNRGAATDVFRRFVLVQLLEDAETSIENARKAPEPDNGTSEPSGRGARPPGHATS